MIIENLRYTRENLGLKQKDLTTLFNVTYSTISGWETGKDTIPLRQSGFKHLQNIKTVETIEKWLFFCQIFIFYLA